MRQARRLTGVTSLALCTAAVDRYLEAMGAQLPYGTPSGWGE